MAPLGRTSSRSIYQDGCSLSSTLFCPSCGLFSPDHQSYRLHVQTCQRVHTDPTCSLGSPQSDARDASVYHYDSSVRRGMDASLSADCRTISCSICNALFKTHTGLRQHMEVKHSVNPSLRCNICGKIMYNKTNLEGHMNRHKGIKPFSCSVCGKTFSYKQSLQAHEKLCYWKG